jgi:hypothetical protein
MFWLSSHHHQVCFINQYFYKITQGSYKILCSSKNKINKSKYGAMYAYVIVTVYVNRTPQITILTELKHAWILSKQVLFYVIIWWHLSNYIKS